MTNKISSTLAKEEDGTIQITFDIPAKVIERAKGEAAEELGKNIEVEGFRPGKAPLEKVMAKIPQTSLIEKTLGKILPRAFSDAVGQYKLKPAIYPKFELISAKEGESWQVRGITCELPEISLGDYKKIISGELTSKSIKRTLTKEEKDQIVIKTLLETIKINVPKILVEDEATARLSNLLERIEKLGLSLESYLASIGKTPETIRAEYKQNAKDAIALELILNKIAEEANIKIAESEIDEAIKVSSSLDTPEQRRIVRTILTRRAALDSLASLV